MVSSPYLKVLACLIALAGCAFCPGEDSSDGLARLLALLEQEPLAALVSPDVRILPQRIRQTSLGRIFHDPEYADGRAEARRRLSEQLGADTDAFWDALLPHLGGPLALAVVADAEEGLRVRLLLAAADDEGLAAIRRLWPTFAKEGSGLAKTVELELRTRAELAAQPAPPEWAAKLAETNALLRLEGRPKALLEAARAGRNGKLPGDLEEFHPIAGAIEHLALEIRIDGEAFKDSLQVTLAPGARGSFATVLAALKDDPLPWKGIQRTLPGGQDVAVLLQLAPAKLNEVLPLGLQALERELRGKKWAQLYGDAPDSLALERYDFFTRYLSGTIGIAGGPSLTGEARLAAAAAVQEIKAAELRTKLKEELSLRGGEFAEKPHAPAIGSHAPLAAAFKGRSFLPAPVIGFSEGWVWVCSNTNAYTQLTGAFSSGKTMAADPPLPGMPLPPQAVDGEEPPPAPPNQAVRVSVNLNSVAPLAYASWVLSPEGAHLGGWKVPEALLPKNPGIFNQRLGVFWTELRREGAVLHGTARGPVPFGSLLPLGVAVYLAHEADRQAAHRKQIIELREVAKELEQAPAPPAPPPPKDSP